MGLEVSAIREEFPALAERFDGRPAIFFDNPGGTQVHRSVIERIADCLTRRNSNTHGAFVTSRRTDEVIEEAHAAAADLLGCSPEEVVYGNNMTTLTFALSRGLAHEVGPGDEIVVTRLDHDANIAPWRMLAEDRGATLRWADIDEESCRLDMQALRGLIHEKTRIVAVGFASNATGGINDVARVAAWAREAGAISFIDAVQYAPHRTIDVKALGCDFLACSAYKFFGPHTGQLYGKREHLERLRAYKVRPADEELPTRWETGTQNHEGMAGTTAAIDYLASLGSRFGGLPEEASRRSRLEAAWGLIEAYESQLVGRLLAGLREIPGVRVFGDDDPERTEGRVSTVSIRKEGVAPATMAAALAERNIFCWDGNFYALELSERLGVEPRGGFLRIGLAHYNTAEEVDRCLEVLAGVA